jgi:integrase
MPRTSTTRAAQGSGTIRQRKDGRWEARYTVGRDPGTGKQIQRSIYGESEKEVLKQLQAVQVDLTNGTYTEPSKMTVGAWLDIWIEEYTKNVKDTTKRAYMDNVRLHIKPTLGAIKIQKLNAHTVQSFYNKLAESDRAKQKGQKKEAPDGLSAKTIRNIHAILHKALKQAVLLSYIKTNPSEACTLPRVEKKEMKILQGNELNAFIEAVAEHRHRELYLTTLFTGMRRGEVLGLTWKCVDFESGTILVDKQMQRERVKGGKLRLVAIKNDKQRRLTPPETVFQYLQDQKRKQTEKRLLAGSLWTDTGLVFTNDIGNPLDADAVYQSYKRLLASNNLSNIRLHDLRHTAATLMIQNGDDIKTVQEALGHHTAAFTLDVYGHVTNKMKRDSANNMERFIQSLKNGG